MTPVSTGIDATAQRLIEGQEVHVAYPFVRDTFTEYDIDGPCDRKTWRPGCRYEVVGREGETEALADGMGTQILTVVDTHKPGRYPMRVFYTIAWVDPDGRRFGKSKLHIGTLDKFRRRASGFMSHDIFFQYRVVEEQTSRPQGDNQSGGTRT